MSFLSKILSRKKKVRQAKIAILGPSKAGKTTFIKFLEMGKPPSDNMISTLGVDYRRKPVKVSSWSFSLIDVGGQTLYQKAFWELVVEQADGIVYVVDATVRPDSAPDLFQEHCDAFEYALDIIPEDMIILILLNKQDLKELNPLSADEFTKVYPSHKIVRRSFALLPVSAKFGDGIDGALEWFAEAMEND